MDNYAAAPYERRRHLPPVLDMSDGPDSGLRSPVKAGDFNNFIQLGYILGLGSKEDVKTWMESATFKPAFDGLLHEWIEPQRNGVGNMGRKREGQA